MGFKRTKRWLQPPKAKDDGAILVGQREWCYLIPALHEGFADPVREVPFPVLPTHPTQPQASPFWETALYLCRYMLGWVDVGLGLQWWESAGRPTVTPELDALSRLFAEEPQFREFALWTWAGGIEGNELMMALAHGGSRQLSLPERRDPTAFCGEDYVRQVDHRHETESAEPTASPWFGGSNGLHLGHSGVTHSPGQPGDDVELVRSDERRRRAVLLLDEAAGWYGVLCRAGRELPQDGWKSFHVDVVVKPLGWLGTFRRSGESGLWFRGKHSVHIAGCPLDP